MKTSMSFIIETNKKYIHFLPPPAPLNASLGVKNTTSLRTNWVLNARLVSTFGLFSDPPTSPLIRPYFDHMGSAKQQGKPEVSRTH